MLEKSGGHLEPNLLKKMGEGFVPIQKFFFFFCHKLLDEKEHFRDGEINHWTKVEAFLYPRFCLTSPLVDCLTLWGEFETKKNPDVKESDQHFRHL